MLWSTRRSSKTTTLLKRPKLSKTTRPNQLCAPLDTPSPFANDRHLVTVMLVRDPRTEHSFGVNLELHTTSALVDSYWNETQQKKQQQQDQSATNSVQVDGSAMNDGNQNEHGNKELTSKLDQKTPINNSLSSLVNAMSSKYEKKDDDTENVKISINNIDGTKQEKKSTSLMNDDTCEKMTHTASLNSTLIPSTVVSVLPIKKKRKRRRRVNFSVMLVTDADKQNNRRLDIDPALLLRSGDIVIEICDLKVEGMTFKDACGVFSRESEKVNESLIQTKVIVARKKAIVAPVKSTSAENAVVSSPKKPVPLLSPPENTSMMFNPTETFTLSNIIWNSLHSSNRVLGQDIHDNVWQQNAAIFRLGTSLQDTALTHRPTATLKAKWLHITRLLDYNLTERGGDFWNKKLKEEFGDEDIPFSSDVDRNAMRHLPRPSKGCRCNQQDHEFLFDPKCTLYRDLQKYLSKEELVELRKQKTKINLNSSPKDLNTIESAFKKRMVKLKNTNENESIEAHFVAKMEEIQCKELRQAVFAPNLTVIILSSIFELQREFPIFVDKEKDDEDMDNNADEEDDDVPLMCLGKRNSEDQNGRDEKKRPKHIREGSPKFCMRYLMRMLDYVNKTWGHVYREPESEEYAWRWEVFQLHSDNDQWETHSTNPRVPGSFPFENLQFGLSPSKAMRNEISHVPEKFQQFEDSISSHSSSNSTLSIDILDQFCLAVHLLSPVRSGLYDELIALLKMGVLKVSSGIPVLADDWWSKVDIVVLDDMKTFWSTSVDPDSKHCVHEEFRDTLEEQWKISDYGWALVENPNELIFDFTVLDEWRETFEGRLEEKANNLEGIGRFGL